MQSLTWQACIWTSLQSEVLGHGAMSVLEPRARCCTSKTWKRYPPLVENLLPTCILQWESWLCYFLFMREGVSRLKCHAGLLYLFMERYYGTISGEWQEIPLSTGRAPRMTLGYSHIFRSSGPCQLSRASVISQVHIPSHTVIDPKTHRDDVKIASNSTLTLGRRARFTALLPL
jgi:hypothetical protein